MIRWLRSKSLLLALGSVLASGFNFYSFVILPAYSDIDNLATFVRHNYLGGLYLSGIVSSVAPLSMYIFYAGKKIALSRYIVISAVAFFLIGVGGIGIAQIPWSYACLIAALCMHAAGVFQTAFIRQERVLVASFLVIFQPFLFALLITMQQLEWIDGSNWAMLYFFSCAGCLVLFLIFADWRWMKSSVTGDPVETVSWQSVILRMAISISFPLFFQLELILFGHFGSADLGEYAMLQKLYSSISVSLFGSIGVLMLSRSLNNEAKSSAAISKSIFVMALASAFCVLPLGLLVAYTGKNIGINITMILLSSFVAFLFTISSFINLKLSTTHPFLALKLLSTSLAFYGIMFVFSTPKSATSYLVHACSFFVFFLLAFYFFIIYPERNRK